MQKIWMIAAGLILLPASAQAADFSGRWQGTGSATDGEGESLACEIVDLTIVHTATAFTVSTDFTCNGVRADIPGSEVTIRGNDLLDKGKTIGSITDKDMDITSKDGDYIMRSQASFTGAAMDLRTVISARQKPTVPLMTFKAALKR